MSRDPRVDAYIDRQAEFARPILAHLRALVHRACPQTDEAIKWGMPAFLSEGKQFAHVAAFKAHASFGLWNGRLVIDEAGSRGDAMGQFGRLASIDDLPDEATLAALLRKARELRNAGVTPRRRRSQPNPAAETPGASRRRLPASPKRRRISPASPPRRNANMSNGSPKRSDPRRGHAGSRRPRNGSPMARSVTGNMNAARERRPPHRL